MNHNMVRRQAGRMVSCWNPAGFSGMAGLDTRPSVVLDELAHDQRFLGFAVRVGLEFTWRPLSKQLQQVNVVVCAFLAKAETLCVLPVFSFTSAQRSRCRLIYRPWQHLRWCESPQRILQTTHFPVNHSSPFSSPPPRAVRTNEAQRTNALWGNISGWGSGTVSEEFLEAPGRD